MCRYRHTTSQIYAVRGLKGKQRLHRLRACPIDEDPSNAAETVGPHLKKLDLGVFHFMGCVSGRFHLKTAYVTSLIPTQLSVGKCACILGDSDARGSEHTVNTNLSQPVRLLERNHPGRGSLTRH